MVKLSKLFSDIAKTASSSGAQFLITLCTTPIMTRLYSPASYATFGIINTTSVLFIGIGLLSLQTVYPQERDAQKRAELIHTMLRLILALSALASLAAIGIAIFNRQHISGIALLFLPLLVITYGVRQICMAIAIERANFSSLSLGQMLEPICARGGAIGLGSVFGGHPTLMLLSTAFGHLTTSITICRMQLAHIKEEARGWLHARNIDIRAVLKRHHHFVLFNTLSQQAQPLALLGIQMTIAAFFSTETAGYYILAVSIITLPAILVSLSTAPAIYRHFIALDQSTPEKLLRHYVFAATLYLAAGLCILSPLFFWGEELFSIAFGARWVQAGTIASILSVAYISHFASVGVQSIFMVTHRLRLQFVLELCACALVLAAAIFCLVHMEFQNAIRCIAFLWLLRNVILLCAGGIVAFERSKK